MWKLIRDILKLLWKLIRTLLENKLRAILKRSLLYTLLLGALIAIIIFIATKLFV